jgi:RecB family exonuclease
MEKLNAAVNIQFLGWNENLVPSLGNYLLKRFKRGETLHLENMLIVLPGSRAQRLLTSFLAEHSSATVFPEFSTPAGLLSLFAPIESEATAVESLLAWSEALQLSFRQGCLSRALNFAARAREQSLKDFLELAEVFSGVHKKLESALARPEKVYAHIDETGLADERLRWECFFEVQNFYQQALDSRGLRDPFSASRLSHEIQLRPEMKRILLCGCWELSALQRTLLEQIRQPIEICIFAPEEHAAGFSELGEILPKFWESQPKEISNIQKITTDTISSLAHCTIEQISALPNGTQCSAVGLCVLDPGIEPILRSHLQNVQLHLHSAEAQPALKGSFAGLFAALLRLFRSKRYEEFLALLEHPLFPLLIIDKDELLQLSNEALLFRDEALPLFLPNPEELSSLPKLITLHKGIAVLQHIREKSEKDGVLTLCGIFRSLLAKLVADNETAGIFNCYELSQELSQMEEHLETLLSECKAFGSVSDVQDLSVLALYYLGKLTLPQPRTPTDIDAFGWLEAPWDNADHLYLLGANSNTLPQRSHSPFLLNESMSAHLGMNTDRERRARDQYLLSLLSNCKRSIVSISSQVDGRDERTFPSPLLSEQNVILAAKEILSASERVISYRSVASNAGKRFEPSHFFKNYEAPDAISVTGLGAYLKCPFTFYLQHILKLEAILKTPQELDALQFGSLLHAIIEHIVADPEREAFFLRQDDTKELRSLVSEHLLKQTALSPHPAIYIQGQSLLRRLEFFMHWLGGRRAAGYEKLRSEWAFHLEIPGTKMKVRGRIDYLERNKNTGLVTLVDFKTNETAAMPERTHFRSGEWQDLQLPMYRYAAERLLELQEPELSYLSLAADSGESGMYYFALSDEMYEEAIALAGVVAGKISAGEFWPPASRSRGMLQNLLSHPEILAAPLPGVEHA